MKRTMTLQEDLNGNVRYAPPVERVPALNAGGIDPGRQYNAADNICEALLSLATGRPATAAAAPFTRMPDKLIGLLACESLHAARITPTGDHPSAHTSQCLAQHGRTDFELRLSNVLNQVGLDEFMARDPLFRLLAPQLVFTDYRQHELPRPADMPKPGKLNEHAEFPYRALSDAAPEVITPATHGALLGLTRPAWINGEWNRIVDIVRGSVARAIEYMDEVFFEVCIAANAGLGPDMRFDGNPVYDAAHSNIVSAGAFDLAKFGAAVALLKRAKSPDGLALSLPASIVLVSPEQEVATQAILAPLIDAQPEGQKVTVRSSPHITGTRFYVLANPAQFSNYRWGWAGPDQRPVIEQRPGFYSDGFDFKLRLDFACGAVGYQGGVTGAGA